MGPLQQKSPTGGYPWRIEETSITKTYIKNTTDQEEDYVAFLLWENGGEYMIGRKTIAAHKTIEIDVKRLRDEQIPDFRGRTIPLYISSGQLQWTLKRIDNLPDDDQRANLALIGRSEQIDLINKTSSNYACQNCCESSASAYVTADPFGYRYSSYEFEVGDAVQFYAFEEIWTCYQTPGEPPQVYPRNSNNWSSNNSNVATVTSGGLATIQNAGEVRVGTNFWVNYSYSNGECPPGPYLTECKDDELSKTETDEITKTQAKEMDESALMLPECGTCSNRSRQVSPDVDITAQPKVQKIQYQEPGTSNYVDITTTLYILKGSAVTFKAIPDPSNSTFPSGAPIWSGTSGATGTGQTISVTFNTVSSSTSDYKTVIAKGSANGTPVTVNVIVYELTGKLTPQDNFTNRSLIKFGLREIVDLSFTSAPAITASQAGSLRWSVQTGTGQLTSQDDGIGTFTAPTTAEISTLRLEVLNGPSKAQFVEITISIVAPSNGYLVKTSNIARNAGAFGGAFKGNIYLEPRDVSFTKIRFSEGSATPTTSGYLNYYSGFNHPATVGSFAVISCATVTGCKVDAEDNILAHSDPPEPPNPATGYVGDVNWAIPWRYHIGRSVVSFTIANHHCASNAIATAALEPVWKLVFEAFEHQNRHRKIQPSL